MRLGVTNLLVDDETTYSLLVSWDTDDADVEQYRVTYISQRPDNAEESVRSNTHAHTHKLLFFSMCGPFIKIIVNLINATPEP